MPRVIALLVRVLLHLGRWLAPLVEIVTAKATAHLVDAVVAGDRLHLIVGRPLGGLLRVATPD